VKLRAGLQRVELAADARRVANRIRFVGDGGGDVARDARDLFAFLNQQIGEIVVELNRAPECNSGRRA